MLKGRTEKLIFKGLLWVFILFLVAVTVFLAGATWEIMHKERIAWQEHDYARAAYDAISLRHETLLSRLAILSTERGTEEELRKRFSVAKEGEEVIVLVDAPRPVEKSMPQKPLTLWERFKGLFGL